MSKDIARILQAEVEAINRKKGYLKNYNAIFIVSYLLDDCVEATKGFTHKIILTCERGEETSDSRSRVIFPKVKSSHYISLEEEMECLVNATL